MCIFFSYTCHSMSRASALAGKDIRKETGDSLYNKGEYRKAISAYKQVIDMEGVSSDINYNLGNCYYKINDLSNCILHYERALKMDPSDRDALYNLSLAREKIKDRKAGTTESFITAWWYSFANILNIHTLKRIGLFSFILFLLFKFSAQTNYLFSYKNKLSLFAYVILGISVTANLAAIQQYHLITNNSGVIVMKDIVQVKSSPTEISTDLFVIHEGAKLEILDDSMNDWCHVKYDESRQGWIKKTDIEKI